mmetsp:Transcript_10477/g.19623  ORF Transcript_10477/g.19623 Transcript_10477/m.19623 type:complete len:411 (+) Transcript_10477:1705-2937(+)
MKRQDGRLWGTQDSRYENNIPTTPGPGEYNFSSDGCFSRHKTCLPRARPKAIPPAKVKIVRKCVSEANLPRIHFQMTDNDLISRRSRKGRRINENTRKRSTFGMGRTEVDPWGRDLPRFNPGPGSYEPEPIGTFKKIETDYIDLSLSTEKTYLHSLNRRLTRIETLRNLHKGPVEMELKQKAIWSTEKSPKVLARLKKKKAKYQALIETMNTAVAEQTRPRSCSVLRVNGPYGRNQSRRLSGRSVSRSTARPFTTGLDTLTDQLNSVSIGGDPSIHQGLLGGNQKQFEVKPMYSNLPSPPSSPRFKPKPCREDIRTELDFIPDEHDPILTAFDEDDDEPVPVPFNEKLAAPGLRKPTFWPDFIKNRSNSMMDDDSPFANISILINPPVKSGNSGELSTSRSPREQKKSNN